MGYLKDNTVELEIDGVIHRVFNQEAEAIKQALIKKGIKVKSKDGVSFQKKEDSDTKK